MSGPNAPGVLYQYRNEAGKMEIVGGRAAGDRAPDRRRTWTARRKTCPSSWSGSDELWDVALLKFVYEFTSSSLSGNRPGARVARHAGPAGQLRRATPARGRTGSTRCSARPNWGGNRDDLKQELDRWGVFEMYQDRFFALFRNPF